VTLVVSFLSLLAVVILSKMLGIEIKSIKSPETTLTLTSVSVVLAILLIPIFITFLSERFLHENRSFVSSYFSRYSIRSILIYLSLGFFLKIIATTFAFFISTNAKIQFAFTGIEITWPIYFLWFAIALALNSLNEELIYRAYPINNLIQFNKINPYLLVLFTAIVFSLMHFLIEQPDLGKFAYRTAFGLLAGMLYLKNRSTMDIIALHTGWNFSALSFSGDTDWRMGGLVNTIGLVDGYEKTANVLLLLIAFGWVCRNYKTEFKTSSNPS
jgi:membrane protease YdiL (CAAX protease family)